MHLPTVQIFILFSTFKHYFRYSGVTENPCLILPNPASAIKFLSASDINFRGEKKRVFLICHKRFIDASSMIKPSIACLCV